jgi:hypothetical protein
MWLWFREGRPLGYAIAGAAILILYGIIPNISNGPLWSGVCRILRHVHCTLDSLGMGCRQLLS